MVARVLTQPGAAAKSIGGCGGGSSCGALQVFDGESPRRGGHPLYRYHDHQREDVDAEHRSSPDSRRVSHRRWTGPAGGCRSRVLNF